MCTACAPDSTIARVCRVVRTTLFSGSTLVSVVPSPPEKSRSVHERGSCASNRSPHDPGPEAAGRPVFCDLLEEVAHRRDVEGELRCERIDRQPAVDDRPDVGRGVGERDGDLLDGIATRLPHVVAADRDRVELGQVEARVLDHVGDEAERRPGRIDVGLPRQKLLEDVVLHRAAEGSGVDSLALADHLVHGQEDWGGRVDRERGRDPVERNAVEDRLHVRQRVDCDADLADLALRQLVVGVQPHLGREIQRDREPGLPLAQEVAKALVGVLGAAPARVEAHRPETLSVHRRIDPARIRILAGDTEPLGVGLLRGIERCVERRHVEAGVRRCFGNVTDARTPFVHGRIEIGSFGRGSVSRPHKAIYRI